MARGLGIIQRKILLLLIGGITLGLSGSPRRYFKVLNAITKEWENINKDSLKRAIERLYESKLVAEKRNLDGTVTLVLTDNGKQKALIYNLEKIKIKSPKIWDKKWRIVLFDIPNDRNRIRDILRRHFKNLGFYEFQKSVFVHPYSCKDEIDYLIEFYDIRTFVRFIVADSIDNEFHLKHYFGLI